MANALSVVPVTTAAWTGPHGRSLPPSSTSAWLAAVFTVATMVRNLVVSGVMAFFTAFLTSQGNVFSGKPSRDQSRVEFLAASMIWTQLLALLAIVTVRSVRLARDRSPSTRALSSQRSIVYWFARILQGLVLPYSMVAACLIVFVWMYRRFVPARLAYLRIEYYVETLSNQLWFAFCDARARHLYRTETAEGRSRAVTQVDSRRKRSAVRYLIRAYIATIPTQVAIILASVYVQIVSQWKFTSARQINLFIAGSLVFKLVTQELAKLYLLARGSANLKTMSVLVSVPTVIIDTQVRVMILSIASAQSTMIGTYILAGAEILARSTKVVFLRFAVRRKQRQVATGRLNHTHFVAWRQRHMRYHTAEALADMYAEYIAILCSSAIAALWTDSSKYVVSFTGRAGASLWTSLVWQAGIEVVVDYIASVIEIKSGIAVDARDSWFGMFLGFVFMMLVILNINISAILYIQ